MIWWNWVVSSTAMKIPHAKLTNWFVSSKIFKPTSWKLKRWFDRKDYPRFLFNFFLSFLQCPKPVIAAIHGACIGGATNMITFADIRYCTEDAYFSVREAALGNFWTNWKRQRNLLYMWKVPIHGLPSWFIQLGWIEFDFDEPRLVKATVAYSHSAAFL